MIHSSPYNNELPLYFLSDINSDGINSYAFNTILYADMTCTHARAHTHTHTHTQPDKKRAQLHIPSGQETHSVPELF
jgi:hypothetical protein